MTWLISSFIVLTAAVVLAVVLWRSNRPNGPTGGEAALRRAEAQRPEIERLVHDLRARRAANNFAPMIQRAMRGS